MMIPPLAKTDVYTLEHMRKVLEFEEKQGRLKPTYFSNEVQELSKELKKLRKQYKSDSVRDKATTKLKINETADRLKQLKEDKLKAVYDTFCSNQFQLKFKKIDLIQENKVCNPDDLLHEENELGQRNLLYYTDDLLTMIVCHLIQLDLKHAYRLRPAERNDIVAQVSNLLDSPMSKIVIRADIKKFFESIPQARLFEKIEQDKFISPRTLKFLKRIFYQFNQDTNNKRKVGIPRGLSFSAYLSELYLKSLDDAMRLKDGVVYFRRYVDDMLLIANPKSGEPDCYWKSLVQINDNLQLSLHGDADDADDDSAKKYCGVWSESMTDSASFDYLGYHWSYCRGKLDLTLKASKMDKYRILIDSIFEIYNKCSHYRTQKVDKTKRRQDALIQLFRRLRVLTGNGYLTNRKNYVATGIFYSNRYLTKLDQWDELDDYLQKTIDNLTFSPRLFNYPQGPGHQKCCQMIINQLRKFSFREGFESRQIIRQSYYDKVLQDLNYIYKKHQPQ